MTIKPRENFPIVLQQKKKSMVFNEQNEKLDEAAEQKVVQMADVQQELWKKQWHVDAAIWKNSGLCKLCNEERQYIEEKTLDEDNDNLLILAHSAALMLESEDKSAGARSHTTPMSQHLQENDFNATDQKCSESEIDGMPVNAHERSEKDGSYCEGKAPRLTQIRHQARLKNHSLVQQSIGGYTGEHLQEKTTRLTQMQPQAWSKSHVLLQETVGECSNGNLQERRMRLSQIRRQARCKVVQDGTSEDHKHRHLDCHTYEDNQTERVAMEQCENIDSCQVVNGRLETTSHQFAGVKSYRGQLKEHQRIARQLRAMRTKKLRGKLGMQHIGTSPMGQMHALKKNQSRQTGLIDLQWLQHISIMSRDPNFIACQQELLGTSKWSKELRKKHLGAVQLQWHAMLNQRSGQIYETHQQHLGNTPYVQNEETRHHFPRIPNKSFQQCKAESEWLSLMSDMQQNEHCRLAALQKGEQHIEGKMTTKNLHEHLNSHDPNEEACELDNSMLKVDHADQQPAISSCHKVDVETEDKAMRVKGRIRLSQLRREARLANAHFIAERQTGIPNTGEEERNEVVMPSFTNDKG